MKKNKKNALNTYPSPCPDIGAQLKYGKSHHEVDPRGELDAPCDAVYKAPC